MTIAWLIAALAYLGLLTWVARRLADNGKERWHGDGEFHDLDRN